MNVSDRQIAKFITPSYVEPLSFGHFHGFLLCINFFDLLQPLEMTEQPSTSQSPCETDSKTPWPAYSEFFSFESKLSNETNFAFTCKLCFNRKIIHANRSSTSNLKKHVNVSFNFYFYYIMYVIKISKCNKYRQYLLHY